MVRLAVQGELAVQGALLEEARGERDKAALRLHALEEDTDGSL